MRTYSVQGLGRCISLNVNSDWSGSAHVSLKWTKGDNAGYGREFRVPARDLLNGQFPDAVDIGESMPLTRSDWGAIVALAVSCRMRDVALAAIEDVVP